MDMSQTGISYAAKTILGLVDLAAEAHLLTLVAIQRVVDGHHQPSIRAFICDSVQTV